MPRRRRDEEDEALAEGAHEPHPPAWTKAELVDAAGVSPKTFDTIRKAARVRGPTHGGLNHVFDGPDLMALIAKVESGRFSTIGKPIAEAWKRLLTEAGLVMPTTISTKRRNPGDGLNNDGGPLNRRKPWPGSPDS